MSAPDSVLEDVRMLVADTLGMELEEVDPDAHWELDLGGESIDLIDLSFRIQKHFGIQIRFQGIASADLALDERGWLTTETLNDLRDQFPFLVLERWETSPFTRPLDLITVRSIGALVSRDLAAQTGVPSDGLDPNEKAERAAAHKPGFEQWIR